MTIARRLGTVYAWISLACLGLVGWLGYHELTVLRESTTRPPELSLLIDGQLDEVRRLTQIVDGLTLLTKADAGLVELDRLPLPLGSLVEEAFEDALILAAPHQVQVTLDHCDPATVLGDRHRLRQLLLILLDNGLKYNRPHGSLFLSLRRPADTVEICITNTNARTGNAIDPKTLEHIFDRFVRGENAQGQVEGCGLGLTIAQWIVQAHGGTIPLLAESDQRTTARLTLPALTDSSSSLPHRSKADFSI